jgi:ribosomal protein S12 methylthiotransferase accessory factor
MSEIYPIEELQFQNNSVGNSVRPALLRLPELTEDECRDLLDIFLELDVADELPLWTLIGLAADAGTTWASVRVGEIKALLGLAIEDEEAILDGCAWISQFGQMPEPRARVYRCIASIVQLNAEMEEPEAFAHSLLLLYGADTLAEAQRLVNRQGKGAARFFGLGTLGANMEGSQMHTQLLLAYEKVRAAQAA